MGAPGAGMGAPGPGMGAPGPGTEPDGGPGPTLVVLAAGQATRYGGVKPLAPVGTAGEAVVDVLVSDALAAGFSTIVLVLGPATAPAIRYHVEKTWPAEVDVRFVLQDEPKGTVDAVLAAAEHLKSDLPFGVSNGDDLYGAEALGRLAGHLTSGAREHALVAFRLRNSLIGTEPVTRGICEVDDSCHLRTVTERRQVSQDGGEFRSGDGLEPASLDGDALVSMNLWGFAPPMLDVLAAAMDEPDRAGGEVLLPDVVSELLGGRRLGDLMTPPFRVLLSEGRCIGVTHPGDLALVQADLAAQVGAGERPAQLWRLGS